MKRKRKSTAILRWLSLALLWAALTLGLLQMVGYSRARDLYPAGTTIAGVPVGDLDREQSAQRLHSIYLAPVVLRYGEATILLNPDEVGFALDLENMFASADSARQDPFWRGYWDYLWSAPVTPLEVPLKATLSEAQLRAYLENQIASRYDSPASPAMPMAGTVDFQPGTEGTELDIESAIPRIEKALRSTRQRSVELPRQMGTPPLLSIANLEILLKQTIDLAGFDGLVGMYVKDLETAQEIDFAYRQGQDIPIPPDVAFSAASIIKIPIMVSILRRVGDNPDAETVKLLQDMIEESGNEAADWVMQRVIDATLSPLQISADMQALGLENTFLAGHFYPGAPLLVRYQTPANQRSDINTDPDVYNQTTPSDIGMLLEDIYLCSQTGGGALLAVFKGEITQSECQTMVEYLILNRMPALIEAGLPLDTRLAHKHGWVSLFGIIHTIGDAGIVYTPGRDYVFVAFLYHPDQLLWDPASKLISTLSRAVYNYFNIPPSDP